MGIDSDCRRSGREGGPEAGFAIPIAIGVGLIMLLLGVTMIVRSQNDQVNASAQKATAKSLAAAETGVSKIQTFLNRYRTLATYPDLDAGGGPPSWESRNDIMCSDEVTASEAERNTLYPSSGDWTDVDTNDPANGEFQIDSYTYGDGVAPPDYGIPGLNRTLVVQGRVNAGGPGESTSQIRVDIPIQPADPINRVAALWVKDPISGGPTINGSTVGPCSLSPSADVFRRPPLINVMPAPPAEDSLSVDMPGPLVALGNAEKYSTPDSAPDLNQSIRFLSGSSVQIWVKGNINLVGQTIQCVKADFTPCDANDPTKLTIYGLTPSPPTTREILLDGGSAFCNVFIHAPEYDVNFNDANGPALENCGTAGSRTIFLKGSLWVKSWAGNTDLDQIDTGTTVPPELMIPPTVLPPQITPVTQWQTEEVD